MKRDDRLELRTGLMTNLNSFKAGRVGLLSFRDQLDRIIAIKRVTLNAMDRPRLELHWPDGGHSTLSTKPSPICPKSYFIVS